MGTYHHLGKAIKGPTEDPWLAQVTKHVRMKKGDTGSYRR